MWKWKKEPKSAVQKIEGHKRHKRNVFKILYKGNRYTIAEFAELAHVEYMTMYMRIKKAKSERDLTGEALLTERKKGRPVEA